MPRTANATRIAIVGDRSDQVIAHTRTPEILDGLQNTLGDIDAYWLHSSSIDATTDFEGFDGMWATPGSPYANEDGVLHAIAEARARQIPFLGTCGGFQHMLLELARNEAGLDVHHGESSPEAVQQLITPLTCSLKGEEGTFEVLPGTMAAEIMGAGPTTERYFCSYGANEEFLPALAEVGLRVGGLAADGSVRMAELPNHPFYQGCLFQPELSSTATSLHPVLVAFAEAAQSRSTQRPVAQHP